MKDFSRASTEHDKVAELAKPLIKYLRDNCHPYTSVVVTEKQVTVNETILSIPVEGID